MQMSNAKYFFSQARKNMVRNGLMTIASLFTIVCCLIILGIFTLLTLNVNHITTQIKDQCEVQLFIMDGIGKERVDKIGDEILTNENVKEASLFTKEDMLSYAKQDMFEGNEGQLSGFENDNPFSDSYKITLHDIAKTSQTVEELETIAGTDHVVNRQDVVDTVLKVSGVVKKFSIAVMALLIVVSVVIIANTIKLTVFNRRKEINIMKYIGATDRFIRVPFLIEGMMIGFLGAIITFLLVSWGYMALSGFVAGLHLELFTLIGYWTVAWILLSSFVVIGTVIGMVGSIISMRKHLKV
jgi:cell division transport system permease protein